MPVQPYPVNEALDDEGCFFVFHKNKLLQDDQVDGGRKCELKARSYRWES